MLTMKLFRLVLCSVVLAAIGSVHADSPRSVVFSNVNIFDGESDRLIKGGSVLVEGNLIKSVSSSPINAPGAEVIDGGGRTLMPGLTDAHVHLMLNDAPHVSIYEKPRAFVGAQAVKISFGTDLVGPLEKQALQPLEFRARSRYFSNVEILRQATSLNAQLFELSGLRHPYREGAIGVIREGVYADLILVDGNPLEDIELMVDPGANFRLIMKDGVIYKNTLS